MTKQFTSVNVNDMDSKQCTCVAVGPRGGQSCPACLAFHARYFPAFPGEKGWSLNDGAINRNSWGIVPEALGPRVHERVSELQITGMVEKIAALKQELTTLKVVKHIQDNAGATLTDSGTVRLFDFPIEVEDF